jgi:hypothetical protein
MKNPERLGEVVATAMQLAMAPLAMHLELLEKRLSALEGRLMAGGAPPAGVDPAETAALERREVERLEARVRLLEETPYLKDCGVYAERNQYTPGDCVTRSGSLWICQSSTSGPFRHDDWRLAVKEGSLR